MFVTGGGLRIDYLITRDGQAMNGLLGGNAIYSAVGARLWTENVFPWARRGENYPKEWMTILEQVGISTNGLVPVDGAQDHRTFYTYTSEGQRVDTEPERHYAKINHPLPSALKDYDHSTPGQDDPDSYEPLAIRPGDWPKDLVNVRAVHLAPLPLSSHLSLPDEIRGIGVNLITVDPGERYMIPERKNHLKRLLPKIDVFLPSLQELRSLFGAEINLSNACGILGDWGAKTVIVKLGARGIAAYQRDSVQIDYFPAFHKPKELAVVDVTGAGDAFCGGFLVGLNSTGEIRRGIIFGLVSASIVVEGYSALYSLRQPRRKVLRRLSQLNEEFLR